LTSASNVPNAGNDRTQGIAIGQSARGQIGLADDDQGGTRLTLEVAFHRRQRDRLIAGHQLGLGVAGDGDEQARDEAGAHPRARISARQETIVRER
jgi:hypothetical protein